MSVASLGSASASTDIRWLSQLGGSGDTTPADEISSLDQVPSGGNSDEPPIASEGSGRSSGSSGAARFSADAMSTLLTAQSRQANSGGGLAGVMILVSFDTDGDGLVSQSEFEDEIGSRADQSRVDALFNKIDDNGDGSINRDELQGALQSAFRQGYLTFRRIGVPSSGSTGDGYQGLLSYASAGGVTGQTSTNSDGSTTTTVSDSNDAELDPTTPSGSSDSSSSGPRNYAADRAEALIAPFDTDGDGKVSRSEYKIVNGREVDQSQVDSVFRKYDVDGDGLISHGELQADRGDQGLAAAVAFHPRAIRVTPVQSTEVTNNPDGTMTITHTFVDGTKRSITGRPVSRNDSGGIGYERVLPEPAHLQSLLKSTVSLQAKLASLTMNMTV